jgi:hypothetical protein
MRYKAGSKPGVKGDRAMKNNQKCVRLSDETLSKIHAWEGEGFNQKLENMVDYCFNARPRLQAKIKEQERRRQAIIAEISQLEKVASAVRQLNRYQQDIKRYLDSAPVPGQQAM